MRLEALSEIPSADSFFLKLSMPGVLRSGFLIVDGSPFLGCSKGFCKMEEELELLLPFPLVLGTKTEFAKPVLLELGLTVPSEPLLVSFLSD